ncbi:ABC transporter ATP-binding protein [Aureimonas jatrophae]|uniref:Amino acid/amide ABC transporter ATP-binding protein 2, HAAT family n=1 Tax=Aureimonas jatrophae TaxID=1166073 RepID=A0A1H0JKI8_9HYPH|nr:ABC transporter ATP-binding protein [Aureimonas jatrophae]MBB3951367.1 branched-chain amino acid transport system ATP-binding protein [Aureimonas jatrophae]SDO43993.1 amino acid/amide ABC transporter ATP-binding protein 2, HAAT family [Aureimonas jatrophae]
MSILSLQGVVAGYGSAPILNGLDLALDEGDIGVIVGPNGAGKSTTLKAVFGLLAVSDGCILLRGEDIANRPTESHAGRGLAFVPQEHNVFRTLSVQENLDMGAYVRRGERAALLDRVFEIFPPLKAKRAQPAGELSGGQRQMVAVGRALMSDPSVLLLDEPTAGLSPLYMSELFDRVVAVNRTGVTVALVEQNARQALGIATRGFVLAGGRMRFTGTGAELLADPDVARSFLGG